VVDAWCIRGFSVSRALLARKAQHRGVSAAKALGGLAKCAYDGAHDDACCDLHLLHCRLTSVAGLCVVFLPNPSKGP
jgi:hypothetical protein